MGFGRPKRLKRLKRLQRLQRPGAARHEALAPIISG
jgi:hypothetical protein